MIETIAFPRAGLDDGELYFVCSEVDWRVWLSTEGYITEERLQFVWEMKALFFAAGNAAEKETK